MAIAALVEEVLRTGRLAGLPGSHFIDGAFTAAPARRLESFDPGTGEAFAEFAAGDAADVDSAVAAARRALGGPWRKLKPAERGRLLARLADLIRAEQDRLAVVEALDSGKRLVEAQGDVSGAARCFEYYAGACDKLQGHSLPLGPDYLGYTAWEPMGVAAQIVPWNYPISTLARGLAPALAAGCTVVVKPAEDTPMTALMVAELATRAGLPPGVVNVVTGIGAEAGAPLVAHPGVDHITFTGSTATGRAVMAAAAAHTTRLVLELGGKSPLVVLSDCDLDRAVEGILEAIFENAGQICSAGSRVIVEAPIRDRLLERLVRRADAMTIGHGLRGSDLGPVVSQRQQDRIRRDVEAARARGVQLACGGRASADPMTGKGWFFQPTIFEASDPADPIVQEEVFGPVLAVQTAGSLEEALALANGTPYGLVAGIYTTNLAFAHRFAAEVDAGQVYINEWFAGGIEVPFGGTRRSGFGREKGLEGLRSYCRLKSVVARL